MRTWSRCKHPTTCGYCRVRMKVGTPMQAVRSDATHSTTATFIRCPLCADGPVPEDLPALEPRVAIKPTGQPSLPLGGPR